MKKSSQLSPEHRVIARKYYGYLKGRRYSEQTIKLYGSMLVEFLLFFGQENLSGITKQTIDRFNEEIILNKGLSVSYQRQFIGAIKLFAFLFKLENIEADTLERPKKRRKLPIVLSQHEVISLLQSTKNLKHRTILALVYSSGLRISEALDLELSAIDLRRNQIHIKQSKGWKDRYVVVSERFLPLLGNYLRTFTPTTYLFQGQNGGKYSAKSVRNFLKRSCEAAGIKKHVTPHTLRHSYATHMLENGIDLRYIQELLGHSKPETTMIYTHVQRKDLARIKSPLDLIDETLDQNTTNIPLSPLSDD